MAWSTLAAAALGLSGAAVATAGPVVPPQWSSSLLYSADFGNINLTGGRGYFYYDGPGQRYRKTYSVQVDLFQPNFTQVQDELSRNISGITGNTTLGEGSEGVCIPQTAPYSDLFSWTANATPNGSRVIAGEPCEVWVGNATQSGFLGPNSVSLSACIGADRIPREFTMQFGAGHTQQWIGNMRYRFWNVTLGDPGDSAFVNTEACATNSPARPCESGRVLDTDVYRVFGPPEPLKLANRDAGDVLGDLSFLCTQGSGAAYRSKLITHWKVKVSAAFGQYSFCNFNGTKNVCTGDEGQLRRVGRRISQMMGHQPHGGQCTRNAMLGSQYSFPEEAMCPPGVAPQGAAGCAWGEARSVRTVSARCVLEERGLLEACQREFGHAPFLESARIFADALASDDPARGGCPDVPMGGRVIVV